MWVSHYNAITNRGYRDFSIISNRFCSIISNWIRCVLKQRNTNAQNSAEQKKKKKDEYWISSSDANSFINRIQ